MLRHRPGAAFCLIGCPDCDPARLARCWMRRAMVSARYRLRVVKFHRLDPVLGTAYVVELAPGWGLWERRAFGGGKYGVVYADQVEPV